MNINKMNPSIKAVEIVLRSGISTEVKQKKTNVTVVDNPVYLQKL